MKGILAWLIGIPLPIIIILYLLDVFLRLPRWRSARIVGAIVREIRTLAGVPARTPPALAYLLAQTLATTAPLISPVIRVRSSLRTLSRTA